MGKCMDIDLLPKKERYCISEIVPVIQQLLGITEAAARKKIYRCLSDGSIQAMSYLGSLRIEREELERILKGERL